MKVFNAREAEKVILKNGFVLKGLKGSHAKYKHPDGRSIVIKFKDLNRMMWQRIVKENGLQGVNF